MSRMVYAVAMMALTLCSSNAALAQYVVAKDVIAQLPQQILGANRVPYEQTANRQNFQSTQEIGFRIVTISANESPVAIGLDEARFALESAEFVKQVWADDGATKQLGQRLFRSAWYPEAVGYLVELENTAEKNSIMSWGIETGKIRITAQVTVNASTPEDRTLAISTIASLLFGSVEFEDTSSKMDRPNE